MSNNGTAGIIKGIPSIVKCCCVIWYRKLLILLATHANPVAMPVTGVVEQVKNAPYAAVIEEYVGYYNDTLCKYPLVNTSKE